MGVGLFTDEVIQDDTNRSALVLVTPAFSRLAAPYATYAWQGLQLRNGSADVASLTSWYVDQLDPGSPQFLRVTSVDTFHAEQAIRPLALALAVFGMIAGSATIVLVSQAVARWIRQARTDQDVLRAIGAETRQLVVTGVQAPLLALAAGSSAALVVAYLASMAMPIGAVRRVEPSPGLDADWTVFIVGGGVMFAILTVLAVATAWRDLARRPRHGGAGALRSRVVQAANALNLPPTVVTGLRHAFEPGDGAPGEGGSVRSVMVGSAVAIAMVSATLTFGASFRTLLDSPDLFGWDWDATIFDGGGYGSLDLAAAHEVFDSRPEIDGWSGAYFGADSLDGRNVPLLGMDPGSTVFPPLSSGRMIESADEIVLGSATSSSIDRRVGDQVTIGAGANGTTLNVVGIATFPTVGILHGAHTSLGVGGLVVPGLVPGFDRRASGEGPPGTGPGPVGPPVILVRFTPGADAHRAQALVSDAAIRLDPTGAAYTVDALRPAEIVNSVEVGRVPALLAAALAAAAAVSLSVALGASVRRRRRDFAVLQSLGLTRRQIAASVAWEATATVTVGLLVGIPGGIALGRWLWVGFAGQLDVVRQASMPGGLLVGVGLGAVGAANLAAAIPARSARRIRPALVLRIK